MLFENEQDLINELSEIDLSNYKWQHYRRFIIPKDEFSYRVATQLDPIDNLLIAALTYQYGSKIEEKRVPIDQKKVFDYRFKPKDDGKLYENKNAWKDFWNEVRNNLSNYKYAVYVDIADFYNRIYHHTLENQLINCGFQNDIIKIIKNMLQNTTQTASQGIPVGPHSMHLYAEMCLIPLDESLILKGYQYCRYSDDIYVFVNSYSEGQIVIYELAKTLDALKLNIQRHKTRIYTKDELLRKCEDMIKDSPVNVNEKEMITVLNVHSFDPYSSIKIQDLSDDEKKVFSRQRIEIILKDYLNEQRDYQRIRMLYRRLSNVGINTGVDITIEEIEKLMPVISDVALYFASVADNSEVILEDTGDKIFKLLDNDVVKSNDFIQLTILNLFANTKKLNNISKLVKLYNNSSEFIKRELIFAAYTAGQQSWIRELKQDYNKMSDWTQRALVITSELLPKDERKFFIQNVTKNNNGKTMEFIAKIIKAK